MRVAGCTPGLWLAALNILCLGFVTGESLTEHYALTLTPGQTQITGLHIKVAEQTQTLTQVSMVTMTHVSLQTTTVMSYVHDTVLVTQVQHDTVMVTQVQHDTVLQTVTATITGTCPAPSPIFLAMPTVLLAASVPVHTPVVNVFNSAAAPHLSSMAISTAAAAVTNAPPTPPSAAIRQCGACHCLCAVAAFPVASSFSPVTAMPVSTIQTLQTLVSPLATNQIKSVVSAEAKIETITTAKQDTTTTAMPSSTTKSSVVVIEAMASLPGTSSSTSTTTSTSLSTTSSTSLSSSKSESAVTAQEAKASSSAMSSSSSSSASSSITAAPVSPPAAPAPINIDDYSLASAVTVRINY
ncbi:hypothetical protein MMC24_000539 [Lignoscripta atroalba]|nr:hypothetical protein [Lignoscripta atroalba]